MKCLALLTAICAVAAATGAQARPRVALVLSGGGAAGAAHVGVIRALEEAGVRPDCVAGTSMGAVVGGLYAAGLTPEELEQAVERTDWLGVLDDSPDRAEQHPLRRQSRTELDTLFTRLPVGVRDGEVRTDAGLVTGNQLLLQLRRLSLRAAATRNFDELPIPFRAVATDLATGDAVVLKDGDLALAMRASMAIPGLFPPIQLDGRVLVDGGVANNLPIDVGRELCGDLVIASSIPAATPNPDDLTSFSGALAQTVSLFIARSSREQLRDNRGVYRLITPPVAEIGMLDFPQAREAMRRGYEAAKPEAQAIARMLGAEGMAMAAAPGAADGRSPAPRLGAAGFEAGADRDLTVNAVRIENTSFYADDVLRAHLDLTPPTKIRVSELQRRLQRIYALEVFDQVIYRLDPGDVLVVTAQGRAAGQTEFRLGGSLEEGFDGHGRYVLGGGVSFTGLDDYGLRVDVDASIGTSQALRIGVERPLDAAQSWFLTGLAAYGASVESFNREPGQRQADYRLHRAEFGVDLSYAPLDTTRLIMGGRYFWRRGELETGDPLANLGHIQQEEAGPIFGVEIDTLDDVWMPTEGVALSASYFQDASALMSQTWRGRLDLDGLAAVDLGGVSAQAFIRGRGRVGEHGEDLELNAIGGFQRLSGFERNAFVGGVAGVAGLRGVVDAPAIERLVGLRGFWGGSLEYGGAWEDWASMGQDNGFLAGSAFVGLRTPMGPAFLGYGAAEGGFGSLYLGFGERF